ncbi:hypothetical protein HTSR_1360 [Halodesulfurarchaeum formicicum]|uniref:Uncharacterized protein n=1 Tax=Halodesulfurarchaeum formicicum TaxID=1873524 RepID=A0A1D8S5A3_9EURY|nr:hypothetical protein [Halodesulfurarchaeum formicicum]AOW80536.1 hypothetical protein HTSR_1360 [Halodesulfurarchaeum formicicum]
MAPITLIEALFAAFSGTLALAGLSVVALAIQAYADVRQAAMLHLSIGFVLIVAAALGTTISTFLGDYSQVVGLLTVNYAITTVGFLFVMYSIVSRN